jgi:hypothetical protein
MRRGGGAPHRGVTEAARHESGFQREAKQFACPALSVTALSAAPPPLSLRETEGGEEEIQTLQSYFVLDRSQAAISAGGIMMAKNIQSNV